MTIEEAINWLQRGLFAPQGNMTSKELSCIAEAYDMAISALRAQQEAEKNEPLTFNDLTYMDGEPVWIKVPLDRGVAIKFWALVAIGTENAYFINSFGKMFSYEEILENNGTIYRHPPKEAQNV